MPSSKLNRKQFAYQTIKNKILQCEYQPNSFLKEELLCEELGVSRTPVRDALSRLEQEHLIQILPKKGFLVAPLSIQEINMVYEGRILLEPYILSTYCKELSQEMLDQMYHLQESYYQDIISHTSDIHLLDNAFHNAFISRCPNRYFIQTLHDIDNQNCRLRILSGQVSDKRLFASYNEHNVVLEHLAQGNLSEAREALETHLLNSKEAAFRTFLNSSVSF